MQIGELLEKVKTLEASAARDLAVADIADELDAEDVVPDSALLAVTPAPETLSDFSCWPGLADLEGPDSLSRRIRQA